MLPVKVSTSSGEWYGEALRSKMRGVIAAVEQAVDDVGADEAPAAGDQDPHAAASLPRAASRLSGR